MYPVLTGISLISRLRFIRSLIGNIPDFFSHTMGLSFLQPGFRMAYSFRIGMKIISLSLMLSPFLVGCSLLPSSGNPSSQGVTDANSQVISGAVFSLKIPAGWKSTSRSDLPTPRYGTIVGAFVSSDVSAGMVDNFVILRDDLDTIITSKQYADLNHVQTARNYIEYTFLGQMLLTFDDGDTAGAYTFEARYNTTTPRLKYIQTAKVCGRNVYLLHLSLALDTDPIAYIPFLSSFRCR